MKKKEIWKPIENWEGYYKVSNYGRILSVQRVVPKITGGVMTINEKIIGRFKNRFGFLKVKLCKEGRGKSYTISHLVLKAFTGESPEDYSYPAYVEYRDGNKENLFVDNLYIISVRDLCQNKFDGNSARKTNSGKWKILMGASRDTYYLGVFDTEEEALSARDEAVKIYNKTGKVVFPYEHEKRRDMKTGSVSLLDTGRWRARIYVNKKRLHLGTFATEKEANDEVDRAIKEYYRTGSVTPIKRKKRFFTKK